MRRGVSAEELDAKRLHREWSQVFHARQWDDLDYELKEGAAIERYGELRADTFLVMRGHQGGRLEALLCHHPLLDYDTLLSLHNEINLDEIYLMPETLDWTFILSHEMYSLCPGPVFAIPFAERPPRPQMRRR